MNLQLFGLAIMLLFNPSTLSVTTASDATTVKIEFLDGYDNYEPFAKEAAKALEKVINSEEFRIEIISKNIDFRKTLGLSNKEIYARIMDAKEPFGTKVKDRIIHLKLRAISASYHGNKWVKNCDFNSRAGTIGYTTYSTGNINTCPERLELWNKENDVASLAAHYAHEYMHVLGFGHKGLKKSKSVPYKIGKIVESLMKNKGSVFLRY